MTPQSTASSPGSAGPGLRIATRGSALALYQARRVAAMLGTETELVIVSTTGDRRRDLPLWQMGGQGVFVREVQEAVLDGRADLAVHSAKDLPSATPDGLVIAAFPEREDPRDALVGTPLAELPTGAVVATGSVRRRVQLAHLRPDLVFAQLRGNIETRLQKAKEFDAAVLAHAALVRLGLTEHVAEVLEPDVMLPQVAQGALAIERRADDERTAAVLDRFDAPSIRAAVTAERAYLAELGGGCDLPVGALAYRQRDGGVELEAMLASPDGRIVLRHRESGGDPEAVGREAARSIIEDRGGSILMGDVT